MRGVKLIQYRVRRISDVSAAAVPAAAAAAAGCDAERWDREVITAVPNSNTGQRSTVLCFPFYSGFCEQSRFAFLNRATAVQAQSRRSQ